MKILAIGDFHGKFPGKLKKKIRKEDFDIIVGLGDYAGLDIWRPVVMKQIAILKKGGEVRTVEEILGKRKFDKLNREDEAAGKKVLTELIKLGKPVISIFGNAEDGWYKHPSDRKRFGVEKSKAAIVKRLKKSGRFKDINYGKMRYMGANFIGCGGYMDIDAYFDRKKFSDSNDPVKLARRVKRRAGSKNKFFGILRKVIGEKIFVLHYPPKRAFDIIRAGRKNPMNGQSTGQGFFNEAMKKYSPSLVLCGHMHEYQGKKRLGGSLVVNPGEAALGRAAIIDYPSLRVKFIK